MVFTIVIGNNGSASRHPLGHSFHPILQPGVTQPGIAQPGVAQPGIIQPGVAQPGITQLGAPQPGIITQRQVVQQGAPHAPQHMTAGFQMSHSKFYTILSKYH